MAKILEFRQMGEFIRGFKGKIRRATARALMRTALAATNQAKRNARDIFKGTRERPKSGNLLNAIFAGFELSGSPTDKRIARASVAVRSRKGNRGTRPYGRILEFGGPIKPRKAKNLWIPLFGSKTRFPGGMQFHNMTPTDFVKKMDDDNGDAHFWILPSKKGGKVAGVTFVVGGRMRSGKRKVADRFGQSIKRAAVPKRQLSLKVVPLFALKQFVKMPARPYVTPAVTKEYALYKQRLDDELGKGKNKPDGGPVPPNKG